MATANNIHECDKTYNRQGLRAINNAVANLGWAGADATASTTRATLIARVASKTGTTVHETQTNLRREIQGALNAACITGCITDTELAADTTVALEQAQFVANDTSLSTNDLTSFAYQSLSSAT